MNQPAAIYARVSSDRQKEDHTIASQTAALLEFARSNGYAVPAEWVFQDEGYSGASLVRPGLEALRDLAAQGQITSVLIYSPDRLSRKYAYPVLLAEELSRCGVEIVFLKSPTGGSPEDQLVVQFQGMIAEYERAQIIERSRRGKRHKAREGVVNVLGGAPYGYRYVKKTDTSAAYYQVIESEAGVVRLVFHLYTKEHLNIRAIARSLNERGIPTRTGKTRWERSTVWGLLRNPAYQGKACYGKTEQRPRQRITRPLRQRNGLPTRNSANHERPRSEWIEVPVPALVSEQIFALAQEQLAKNKRHSLRRTIERTLLQGMLVCQRCGYALYRSSTRTTKRKLYYYRCFGSDAYRQLKGPLCTNRPIRQDYLDQFVWDQIIRLLENDTLMQAEIDRRRETARNTDPLRQRQEALRREQVRLGNNVERLITAYQEGLISLLQLRERMPELTKKSKAVEAELQSLETGAMDHARYLQLAENLSAFREKLHARAKTLDVCERQHILRLLVKEVLVDTESLTIRHSIPIPRAQSPAPRESPAPKDTPPSTSQKPSYLLRPRGSQSVAGQPLSALCIRFVDAADVSERLLRALCGRCDRPLQERAAGPPGVERHPTSICRMRSGASRKEDSDCLLQR
jgi:site-specific DNA recombinase